MTDAEKETRLWCVMLRATYDRASSRQHKQRKHTSASSSGSTFLDTTPSDTELGPSPQKKQSLSLEGTKNIHKRTDSENLRDQLTTLQLRKAFAEASTSPRTNETENQENRSNSDDVRKRVMVDSEALILDRNLMPLPMHLMLWMILIE
jgi:hypothetical protein